MFSLFKPFNLGDLADQVLPTLHVPLIVYAGFLSEEQKDWTGCSLSHCHVLFCGELRDNNKSPEETWCQGSTAELPNLTTLMYTACFYLSACFLGGDYSIALGRCCSKNLPGLFAPQKTKSKEKVYHRTFLWSSLKTTLWVLRDNTAHFVVLGVWITHILFPFGQLLSRLSCLSSWVIL